MSSSCAYFLLYWEDLSTQKPKHMITLAERIARAVRSVIDPIEEMPFLADCPMEEVNPLVEEYLNARSEEHTSELQSQR